PTPSLVWLTHKYRTQMSLIFQGCKVQNRSQHTRPRHHPVRRCTEPTPDSSLYRRRVDTRLADPRLIVQADNELDPIISLVKKVFRNPSYERIPALFDLWPQMLVCVGAQRPE